jgi:hypothetical protein
VCQSATPLLAGRDVRGGCLFCHPATALLSGRDVRGGGAFCATLLQPSYLGGM